MNITAEQVVIDERTHFHPIVKAWLEERSFTYQHELSLPVGRGRVDFYATQGDEQWIIEAKLYATQIKEAHRQLVRYARALAYTKLAIAVIGDTIKPKHEQYARAFSIELLALPRPANGFTFPHHKRITNSAPVSLYPLDFEQAVRLLLNTPPPKKGKD